MHLNTPTRQCKYQLVTVKHDLKKFHQKRMFKCNICHQSFNLQSKINKHHKEQHPLFKCKIFHKLFSTPLTLEQHHYTYKIIKKYPCRCGKVFFFLSELKVHKYSHCRIRSAICTYPGCTKSYFNKNNLAKHALIYKKITWDCDQDECKYSTPDKWLL